MLISIDMTWYRLRVIHIFVEHIVTKFDGTEIYAKRLQLVSNLFISHLILYVNFFVWKYIYAFIC